MDDTLYKSLLNGSFITPDNLTGQSDRDRNSRREQVQVIDATISDLYAHGKTNNVYECDQALGPESYQYFWGSSYRERLLDENITIIVRETVVGNSRFPTDEIDRVMRGTMLLDELITNNPIIAEKIKDITELKD